MKFLRVFFPLLAALALSFAPGPAATAQGLDSPVSPGEVAAPSSAAPAAAPAIGAAQSTALPERAAPPRTLRAYWHVFVAFAITWLLLFGYVISLGRRFSRIERDLQGLAGGAPQPE